MKNKSILKIVTALIIVSLLFWVLVDNNRERELNIEEFISVLEDVLNIGYRGFDISYDENIIR